MRIAVMILLLAGSLWAQYPAGATALRWDGVTSDAGPFCWGFEQKPAQATIVAGESGTLTVRGEWNQSYALAMSPGASGCLTLPRVFHCLVLDAPVVLLRFGICDEASAILACPNGTDSIAVTVPRWMPKGASFSMQAIVSVPSGPALPLFAFTQAITFAVL